MLILFFNFYFVVCKNLLFIFFLKILDLYFIYVMSVLPAYMYMYHVHAWSPRSSEEGSDPL